MRRVLPGDVAAAGCALLCAAPSSRPELLRQMLARADAADAHRLATGRAHPRWGNGSLMAAAMAKPRLREPFLDDQDYAACMVLLFTALMRRGASGPP